MKAAHTRHEIEPGVVQGEFSTPMADGRARCELCPRFCTLAEGQRGFCFVRQGKGGGVVLNSYGRSTGFCVDPIEKKPLNHFLPGTSVLSFGTAGCNLGCKFCQNWSISKSKETALLSDIAYPDAIARSAKSAGVRSVAYTYNDPVIFHEYVQDTAAACHEVGIANVVVSAGYVSEKARPAFFKNIDAANIDLKAFTQQFYRKLCLADLAPVLDTLKFLKHETDVWFEITTLLIPGENDSEREVAELSEWIVENLGPDVPLHFSAYHPDFRFRSAQRTPQQTLTESRKRALDAGIRHVYTGNTHDPAGQSTYCSGCGEMLIGRDRYSLSKWRISEGKCMGCSEKVAGVFDEQPGTWGRRRAPLRII